MKNKIMFLVVMFSCAVILRAENEGVNIEKQKINQAAGVIGSEGLKERNMIEKRSMIQSKEEKREESSDKDGVIKTSSIENKEALRTRTMEQERKQSGKEESGKMVKGQSQDRHSAEKVSSPAAASDTPSLSAQQADGAKAASGETVKNAVRNKGENHKIKTSEKMKAGKSAGRKKGGK